jgi:hypothetical protein
MNMILIRSVHWKPKLIQVYIVKYNIIQLNILL